MKFASIFDLSYPRVSKRSEGYEIQNEIVKCRCGSHVLPKFDAVRVRESKIRLEGALKMGCENF